MPMVVEMEEEGQCIQVSLFGLPIGVHFCGGHVCCCRCWLGNKRCVCVDAILLGKFFPLHNELEKRHRLVLVLVLLNAGVGLDELNQ